MMRFQTGVEGLEKEVEFVTNRLEKMDMNMEHVNSRMDNLESNVETIKDISGSCKK